jgi:hypothetical protein
LKFNKGGLRPAFFVFKIRSRRREEADGTKFSDALVSFPVRRGFKSGVAPRLPPRYKTEQSICPASAERSGDDAIKPLTASRAPKRYQQQATL